MGVLIWQLTGSALDLGLVGFASTICGFMLAPFAGVFSDRWPRRRVLLVTQSLAMVQAAILATLTLTGIIQVWHIMVLAAVMSLIMAFDIPTRQSFVVQMVDRKEDLPNAIALNSFLFNGARLIGPVVAGIVMPIGSRWLELPFSGEGLCFAINSISFLAVIISLAAMRIAPYGRRDNREHVLRSLKDGFSYAFHFRPIRAILIMLGIISFLGMPYNTLLPAIDAKVIHHSTERPQRTEPGGVSNIPPATVNFLGRQVTLPYARTYGMFLASIGMGAIAGALYLASRKSVIGLQRMIPVATTVFGLAMIGFSLSRSLWLSMGLLSFMGFGFMVQMASSNTLLQTVVDEDKRGRVMSFYTMSFQGTAPFGALLAGWLASALGQAHGEQITIAIAGLLLIVAAGVFASRLGSLQQHMEPVYVRLGILSENAPIPREAATQDIEKESR